MTGIYISMAKVVDLHSLLPLLSPPAFLPLYPLFFTQKLTNICILFTFSRVISQNSIIRLDITYLRLLLFPLQISITKDSWYALLSFKPPPIEEILINFM